VPVLVREVIEFLDLHSGHIVVDGTVGTGGHGQAILKRIGPTGTLIGLDRDPMMLELASSVISEPNCYLRHANYADLSEVLEKINALEGTGLPKRLVERGVDRILLDLGLSSNQLADPERGFSFSSTGPLDLRYDTSQGEPAWRYIKRLDERKLANILWDYGEERFSRRIARQLVSRRRASPVHTASDLVEVVAEAIPNRFLRRARKHPATRVFQALRIAVNEELAHLESSLQHSLYDLLSPTGRLVVISFHSLEDRLTKHAFRDKERWENLTRKPVTATPAEKRENSRSRSAKLRAAMKK